MAYPEEREGEYVERHPSSNKSASPDIKKIVKKRRMRTASNEPEDLYSKYQIDKKGLAHKMTQGKVEGASKEDTSSDKPGAGADFTKGMGQSAMKAGASNMGGAGSGANIVAGGLMATGNPYAAAAGAGLMVLGAKKAREEKYKANVYQAKVSRIERQQQSLQAFMQSIQSGGSVLG